MAGGVFVIQADGKLIELTETPFAAEENFQQLLAKHPSLLAGDQIAPDSPRRWLLIAREIGVPGEAGGGNRWALDHLFLDQDGVPTFVEVKRSSDTRIRREVVGQMLDYAANAVAYWPGDRLEAQFESTCKEAGRTPEVVLGDFLGSDDSQEAFWQEVRDNLAAGRLRLIFAADRIPAELRRIVEFLNEQMERLEVLAVEIRRFAGGGVRTLVPRVIGITEKARTKKGAAPRREVAWDRASFLARLHDLGSQDIPTAVRILDWAEERGCVIQGGRGTRMAGLNLDLREINLFAIDEWDGAGRIRVNFYLLPEPLDRDPKRSELLSRLNELRGVDLPPETRYQGIPMSVVAGEAELEHLLKTLDWVIEVIGFGK